MVVTPPVFHAAGKDFTQTKNSRIGPHSVRSAQLIPIACVTSYEHQDASNSSSCAPPLNAFSLHHKIGRILSIGHQGVAFDYVRYNFRNSFLEFLRTF